MKARKLFALVSLAVLFTSNAFTQAPVWTSGPTATPHVMTVDVTFTLDRNSNVYFVAYNSNIGFIPTSVWVQTLAVVGNPAFA